jgi:hypothetical protein
MESQGRQKLPSFSACVGGSIRAVGVARHIFNHPSTSRLPHHSSPKNNHDPDKNNHKNHPIQQWRNDYAKNNTVLVK